tara:strand:- start:840 stop:1703 length:864 start_codon:yes stop_codon:yes gene_type:complete
MPEMDTNTPVAGVNTQPLHTDSDVGDITPVESETATVEKSSVPTVENRDGKLFVDGVRVFTRDDTNRIAAKAKTEVESNLLKELNVDSLKQVKTVVNQLQTANIDESEGNLNVNALRDAVKKREQTVEELRNELHEVKTQAVMTNHLGKLQNEMPTSWANEQKTAVIDLMKARNMFAVEGDTFQLRNGNDYITTDGETPDYKSAVEMVGKNLGLPFAKKGASVVDADGGSSSVTKGKSAVNDTLISSDPEYRSAYLNIREQNKTLMKSDITDTMVLSRVKKIRDLRS